MCLPDWILRCGWQSVWQALVEKDGDSWVTVGWSREGVVYVAIHHDGVNTVWCDGAMVLECDVVVWWLV